MRAPRQHFIADNQHAAAVTCFLFIIEIFLLRRNLAFERHMTSRIWHSYRQAARQCGIERIGEEEGNFINASLAPLKNTGQIKIHTEADFEGMQVGRMARKRWICWVNLSNRA